MKWTAAWLVPVLLAGCVATQEESASKQGEAYVKQLNQKLTKGMALPAAIAEVEAGGFKCYEPSAPPIPMGHTIVCNHGTQQAWGVILQGDGEAKLTTVRAYERTAVKR